MCTRILYETGIGTYITGRGVDWNDPTAKSTLIKYPRGMEQNGGPAETALKWKSKYGSILSTIYDAAACDAVNECGLVANTLYLAESDYGDPDKATKPLLSVTAWAQYFVDNFATVAESVEAMQNPSFDMTAPMLPNGRPASVHLSLSDPTGDSAILEYIDGGLQIHHSREYVVMTNSPVYDDQISINKYWDIVGGNRMLPGTINAADRFVRASYLLKSTPKFDDPETATAAAFSIMRAVGVPLGMEDPDHPNISATLWRTVFDHDKKRFYFDDSAKPAVFWVDLENHDFSEGSPIIGVSVDRSEPLFGEVSAEMKPMDPIKWI